MVCCRRSIEAAAQETALNLRSLFAVVARLNGCQLMPYRGSHQALRESATLCFQRAGGEAGADTGMGRTGVSGLLCWVNTPAMACQEEEPGLVGPPDWRCRNAVAGQGDGRSAAAALRSLKAGHVMHLIGGLPMIWWLALAAQHADSAVSVAMDRMRC